MNNDTTYALLHATAMAAAHPDTFKIPSRRERKSLVIGDFVLLCFERPVQIPDMPRGERMWVRVIGRDGRNWVSTLENEAFRSEGLPPRGATVMFRPRNVLNIMTAASIEHQCGGLTEMAA